MGIIQKQSIRSSLLIFVGFALGAFNILFLAPKILTAEQLGLTRMITDVGLTLATFCTLGSIPVIYKFSPFYKAYLPSRKNDLPFITLVTCIIGFIIICIVGYFFRDLIIRKYTDKAPSFVAYSYLIYPFCFFMLLSMWLEAFSWTFKKTVQSNVAKELAPRLLLTLLMVLFALQTINLHWLLLVFSVSYLLPAAILFFLLRKTNEFHFTNTLSPVTRRLGKRMVIFGGYIYAAQFLNLLSKTSDSIIISAKSTNGLADTALFTIATYIVTLMEIPQRSLIAITVPVLSESWRNKDMNNIRHIYNKSVSNMLAIGLCMFALLWLNAPNMGRALGKDYTGIETIVLWLGMAKLIDIGTGANGQILGTSSYWRVDFTTNVIYTCLAIPLNYFLISSHGLMGAAYSAIISQVLYNSMRFGFLWYKFNMQPFVAKHLLIVGITAGIAGLVYMIPRQPSFIIDAIIRTSVFCVAFLPVMYALKVSVELNEVAKKFLNNAISFIRRR